MTELSSGSGTPVQGDNKPKDIMADVALTVFHPSATSVEAGFFTWDISSDEVTCDPVTSRMHGLADVLVATMDAFLARVPESDLLQVRQAMAAMVASAGTYQLEYRVIGDDGGLRSMEARGRVMPGPDGRPARMMGLVMDTTAMRARRESEERQLREQRALSTELQRGMLPRGPLVAPGLSIVARYQAATSGIEIGGDFYDVVNCADGQVALVIGDVQGHNLLAASLMGRLRTTVHAYAREGHSPQQVMAVTNRWLTGLNTDPDLALFATCCLVVLDPATGQVSMSRAGHPPPVLVSEGASPRIIDCDAGIPLGIDPEAEYTATELTIAPGSLLVLITDGLLVTDSDDDYNLGRLLDMLAMNSSDDLDELADKLLSSARLPRRHDDDVALLIARTH